MARIEWNPEQIHVAVFEAFDDTILLLEREFIKEIVAEKWSWPTAPTKRDIVDQSGLKDSTKPIKISSTVVEFHWTVDYALAVHNGATFRDGTVFPARPWTKEPLEKAQEMFNESFKRIMRRQGNL